MSLIESNDKGSTFDDVNWAWLLPLLLFLPTLEPPKRREITINANASGKSVNITYDPHDPEAVKAVEAWRKALFAEPSEPAPDNTGYFWEWDNGASVLRWRERPQEDAKCICRIHYDDTISHSFFLTAISPYGSGLATSGVISAPTLQQAKAIVETVVAENLQAHYGERLRAWKPMNPQAVEAAKRKPGAAEMQDERRVTFDSEKPAETVNRNPDNACFPYTLPKDVVKAWSAIALEWHGISRAQKDGKECVKIYEKLVTDAATFQKNLKAALDETKQFSMV